MFRAAVAGRARAAFLVCTQRRGYLVWPAGEADGAVLDGSRDEITLYIKGFLSPGETAKKFDDWFSVHRTLELTHKWGRACVGFHWDSGSVLSVADAVPVPLAMLAMGATTLARRASLPSLGVMLSVEAAVLAGRVAVQYRAATRNAADASAALAATLSELRRPRSYVRVVAHSLGCVALVGAIGRLPPALRPDEVHLCAPALGQHAFGAAARDGLVRPRPRPHVSPEREPRGDAAAVYYAPNDWVLSALYFALSGGEVAVGCAGVAGVSAARLRAVNASSAFSVLVHTEYRAMLPSIALAFARDAV